MAAFMASAHAKFTGELGVYIVTSGPGASHLITGLYDARLDHMPVLATTRQQARAALSGRGTQKEVGTVIRYALHHTFSANENPIMPPVGIAPRPFTLTS
jgi:thiamine pyrophosphate-dependent acetolactate synthase large subunit-like protein